MFEVFVYGSLRQGASNSFRMTGAEFLGPGVVSGRLYRVDWYPGIKLPNDRDDASEVIGEVYRIGESMMAALDEYEGGEYQKKSVQVRKCENCDQAIVWEYLPATEGLELIESGDWMDAESL